MRSSWTKNQNVESIRVSTFKNFLRGHLNTFMWAHFLFIFYLFYVSIFTYTHMCVSVCMCVCVGQRSSIDDIEEMPNFIFEIDSLTEHHGSLISLGWLASEPQDFITFHLPRSRIRHIYYHTRILCGYEVQTQSGLCVCTVSTLQTEWLPWAFSPSPELYFHLFLNQSHIMVNSQLLVTTAPTSVLFWTL